MGAARRGAAAGAKMALSAGPGSITRSSQAARGRDELPATAVTKRRRAMSYADERVAAEMGRAMMALYRAGMQVRLVPDPMHGRAQARIVPGPTARRRSRLPRSASGRGDSPLAALHMAVERLNERAGAILVELD
jgi:hypothetical protein